MKKILILGTFLLASTCFLHAQNNLIHGRVYYLNAQHSIIHDSTIVKLCQGNLVIMQMNVDSTGAYSFANIPPGNYTLQATTTKKWGGVNQADLSLLFNFILYHTYLSTLPLKAADVNGSSPNNPNTADALAISRRICGQINSFQPPNVPPPGGPDWYSAALPVNIQANMVCLRYIFVLCAGDVNGSFIPY